MGYKVVFQSSKFQKSLAWWLLIQLIRCQTLAVMEVKESDIFLI